MAPATRPGFSPALSPNARLAVSKSRAPLLAEAAADMTVIRERKREIAGAFYDTGNAFPQLRWPAILGAARADVRGAPRDPERAGRDGHTADRGRGPPRGSGRARLGSSPAPRAGGTRERRTISLAPFGTFRFPQRSARGGRPAKRRGGAAASSCLCVRRQYRHAAQWRCRSPDFPATTRFTPIGQRERIARQRQHEPARRRSAHQLRR